MVKVKAVEVFNQRVASLHLLAPCSQRYLAGQSIQLSAHGATGDYAIASCACEERHIEIQILRKPEDAFAALLLNHLKTYDSVKVRGPYGIRVGRYVGAFHVIVIAFGIGFGQSKA